MIEKPMTRLKALLGPPPSHPWAALIPQILVWSFRRFCIESLYLESDLLLSEQIWSDFFDLIQNYGPKGLETVGPTWLLPEHIQYMSSDLENYSRFFLEFVDFLDQVMATEDAGLQEIASQFLDHEIFEIFDEWLAGAAGDFRIFPSETGDDNEFTDEQFVELIRRLMEFSKKGGSGSVHAAKPEPVAVVPEPEPEPAPEPESPAPEPLAAEELPPFTAAAAIKRKRRFTIKHRIQQKGRHGQHKASTFRNKGRNKGHGKTRKALNSNDS